MKLFALGLLVSFVSRCDSTNVSVCSATKQMYHDSACCGGSGHSYCSSNRIDMQEVIAKLDSVLQERLEITECPLLFTQSAETQSELHSSRVDLLKHCYGIEGRRLSQTYSTTTVPTGPVHLRVLQGSSSQSLKVDNFHAYSQSDTLVGILTDGHVFFGTKGNVDELKLFKSFPLPTYVSSVNALYLKADTMYVSVYKDLYMIVSANGTYSFDKEYIQNKYSSVSGDCYSSSKRRSCLITEMTSLEIFIYEIGNITYGLESNGWVDPTSPKTIVKGGKTLNLVWSDEFNDSDKSNSVWGATPPILPYWQSNDQCYGSEPTYTDGKMVLDLSVKQTDYEYCKTLSSTECQQFTGDCPRCILLNNQCVTPFQSTQVSTWNAVCYAGGYIEAKVKLPSIPGAWPAFWMLGNLGRVNFRGSLDGTWPYSFEECTDTGFMQTNGLSPSRFGDCPMRQWDQGGLRAEGIQISGSYPSSKVMRGVPEIDVMEVMTSLKPNPTQKPKTLRDDAEFSDYMTQFVSQSFQIAPLDGLSKTYNKSSPLKNNESINTYGEGYIDLGYVNEQPSVDSLGFVPIPHSCEIPYPDEYVRVDDSNPKIERNYWNGCQYQQAYSYNSVLDGYESEKTFGMYYEPSEFVEWYNSDYSTENYTWHMNEKVLKGTSVSTRTISGEPLYMILNIASSPQWGNGVKYKEELDLPNNNFRTKLEVEYVRIYQEEHNIGCDTPMYPTHDYITRNDHDIYTDLDVEGYPNVNISRLSTSSLRLTLEEVSFDAVHFDYMPNQNSKPCVASDRSCSVLFFAAKNLTNKGFTVPYFSYSWSDTPSQDLKWIASLSHDPNNVGPISILRYPAPNYTPFDAMTINPYTYTDFSFVSTPEYNSLDTYELPKIDLNDFDSDISSSCATSKQAKEISSKLKTKYGLHLSALASLSYYHYYKKGIRTYSNPLSKNCIEQKTW